MFSSSPWFPSSGTWSWSWTWCSSWWPSSTSLTHSTSLTSAPRMRHSGTKDPSNLQRWPWFHLQEPDRESEPGAPLGDLPWVPLPLPHCHRRPEWDTQVQKILQIFSGDHDSIFRNLILSIAIADLAFAIASFPLVSIIPMHFSLIFPKPNEKLDIFGNFSRCSTLTLYLAARTLGAAASDPPAPPAPQWGPGFWRYPSPVNTEVKYTKSSERVFQHCLFIVIYSYNLLQSQ